MIAYTDGADRYHTAYSFVLLREAFGAGVIRGALEEMARRSATAWPSWAFSNHDVVRAPTRWGGRSADPAFARLLVALLACLRGTVFLYQGEELGLPQADVPFERLQDREGRTFWPRHKGRDGARTPLPWRADAPFAGFSTVEPWLPVDPRHAGLAVDRQLADAGSTLAFTRALLAWRRAHPALKAGAIRFLDAPEPLLVFVRQGAGEVLLCAFNLGSEPHAAALTGAERFRPLAAPEAGGRLAGGHVSLPGHGYLIARA